MSNLDFSGLFGGGAFAIDPTKFNFSAYTPEPKKEVVTDPVDVVSNNTPNAQVEILEGAGTVAVTKPDPIAQAIESLQGKDLTQSVNVNPLASIEEQIQIAPLTSNIPVSSGEATNASFLDVGAGQTGVSSNIDYDVGAEQVFDLLDGSLDSNDKIKEINEYLKGEQFGEYVSEYDSRLSMLGDYDRVGGATTNLLNQVGLSKALGVEGEYGGSKLYNYNPETNQYELVRDTEKSMLEAAAPDIVVGLATAAATAGLGSALGAVTGATTATGNAIAQGIASATVTKITGGDTGDVLQSAVMGGLSGYTKGLQVDINNAQGSLTQLQNVANSNVLGESLIAGTQVANAAETVQALQSQMSLVNNIKYGINLVEAADSKDILGVINAGMQLSGNDTLKTAVQGVLTDNFDSDLVARHGDAMSEAILKTTDKLIKGEGLDSALISGMVQYGRSGGGLGLEMPEGDGSFDLGIALETPEWVDEFVKVVQGGIKWVDTNVTRPTVKTIKGIIGETGNVADAAIRALPTEIEDWERLGDTIVKGGESVVEGVDEIVREIPTTKEDWEGAVDTVKSAANTVEETYQEYIEEPIEEAAGAVREFIDEVLPSSPDAPRLDVGDIPTVDLEGLDLALDLGFGSRPQKELEDSDIIKYKRSNPITYDTSIEDLTNLLLKS